MTADFAKYSESEAEDYGRECRRAYDASPMYAGLAHPLDAQVGIKLFLPPESVIGGQRAAWRRGWDG